MTREDNNNATLEPYVTRLWTGMWYMQVEEGTRDIRVTGGYEGWSKI